MPVVAKFKSPAPAASNARGGRQLAAPVAAPLNDDSDEDVYDEEDVGVSVIVARRVVAAPPPVSKPAPAPAPAPVAEEPTHHIVGVIPSQPPRLPVVMRPNSLSTPTGAAPKAVIDGASPVVGSSLPMARDASPAKRKMASNEYVRRQNSSLLAEKGGDRVADGGGGGGQGMRRGSSMASLGGGSSAQKERRPSSAFVAEGARRESLVDNRKQIDDFKKPIDDTKNIIEQFSMRKNGDGHHGVPTVVAVAQAEAMRAAVMQLRTRSIDCAARLAAFEARQPADSSTLDRVKRSAQQEARETLKREQRLVDRELAMTEEKFAGRRDDVLERTGIELIKAVEAYERTYDDLRKPKGEVRGATRGSSDDEPMAEDMPHLSLFGRARPPIQPIRRLRAPRRSSIHQPRPSPPAAPMTAGRAHDRRPRP